MPSYTKQSLARLSGCDRRLQLVFTQVIKHFDCTILEGQRSELEQAKLFREGKTKVRYPNSKHNMLPSKAVDVTPYPIMWEDRERYHLFAGFVLGIAKSHGVELRWGGDWNRDTEVRDNGFDDLVHFELVDEQ